MPFENRRIKKLKLTLITADKPNKVILITNDFYYILFKIRGFDWRRRGELHPCIEEPPQERLRVAFYLSFTT